jgi:hypothetical protein
MKATIMPNPHTPPTTLPAMTPARFPLPGATELEALFEVRMDPADVVVLAGVVEELGVATVLFSGESDLK